MASKPKNYLITCGRFYNSDPESIVITNDITKKEISSKLRSKGYTYDRSEELYLKYTCENRGYWIEIQEIKLNNFDNILV